MTDYADLLQRADWRAQDGLIGELATALREVIAERDELDVRVLAVDGEGGEGDQQLMRIARLEEARAAERTYATDRIAELEAALRQWRCPRCAFEEIWPAPDAADRVNGICPMCHGTGLHPVAAKALGEVKP